MSLQTAVRDAIKASSALVTAFTGGIIAYDDMDGYGLTRTSYPTAFSTTSPLMKPTIMVRERSRIFTGNVRDEEQQAMSYTQAVEVWFYDDRKNGYTTIDSGQRTVFGLLHEQTVNSARLERRELRPYDRDPDLQYACVLLAVYDARGVETP